MDNAPRRRRLWDLAMAPSESGLGILVCTHLGFWIAAPQVRKGDFIKVSKGKIKYKGLCLRTKNTCELCEIITRPGRFF